MFGGPAKMFRQAPLWLSTGLLRTSRSEKKVLLRTNAHKAMFMFL